jgi:hypothetical protein
MAENLVEFVTQPQFSDLLPTYLSVLDDQTINQIRNGMVRALINARRERPEDSEFKVLNDMVRAGDRSLNILLISNFANSRFVQTPCIPPKNHLSAPLRVGPPMRNSKKAGGALAWCDVSDR